MSMSTKNNDIPLIYRKPGFIANLPLVIMAVDFAVIIIVFLIIVVSYMKDPFGFFLSPLVAFIKVLPFVIITPIPQIICAIVNIRFLKKAEAETYMEDPKQYIGGNIVYIIISVVQLLLGVAALIVFYKMQGVFS